MKTNKLEQLSACFKAVEYVKAQKSAKDAWINCTRGDWMLWIAKRLNVDDRKLTLAKSTCANQVKHLMKDKRSIDALNACFKYANGEITREELNIFAAAANAADAAAYAAANAAANAAAYAANAANAQIDSLKKSANICREILTDEVLLKYKKLKNAKE